MSVAIGLVGARGYVGREMIALIAAHPEFDLAFAGSRELAGTRVSKLAPEYKGALTFSQTAPEDVGRAGADAVVLGLPNGKSAPFIAALEELSPATVVLDLSGDHRDAEGWAYGLPELERDGLRGARRIANPGCYATAAQLALAPVADLVRGPATVFGVSGWSGAGTRPSRKTDPDALKDNIQPYGLQGHAHEAEIARGVGLDIRFHPSVAPFFRGLTVVASADLARDAEGAARARFRAAYAEEPFVMVQDDAAEPAAVAGTHLCRIGAIASDARRRFVATAALDNLLKGAASQAIQNLNLAFELPETTGLDPAAS
ncbi:MAG: N-acetyl-gamma-glutamyl-phosphate reductase [Pseudomonadota bacterium]